MPGECSEVWRYGEIGKCTLCIFGCTLLWIISAAGVRKNVVIWVIVHMRYMSSHATAALICAVISNLILPSPSRAKEQIKSWKIGQVQHHDCSCHAHRNLSLLHQHCTSTHTYHSDKISLLVLGNGLWRTPSHVSTWPHILMAQPLLLSEPLLLPIRQGWAGSLSSC